MAFNPIESITSFISDAQRVLIVSRKPDTAEYMNMVRITAVGLIILGLLGFAVELASFLLKGSV